MFKAPKLANIYFGFSPVKSIEAFAISHLSALERFQIRQNKAILTLSTNSLALPLKNSFIQLDTSYTTLEFQPGFITNLNPTASFEFEGSNVDTFDEAVFSDVFKSLASCADCNAYHESGHITDIDNLECDCNILWILLEDETYLDVINEYDT